MCCGTDRGGRRGCTRSGSGCFLALANRYTALIRIAGFLYWQSWLIQVCPSSGSLLILDRIYYQALSLFPQISIIANGINDLTVPYPTAAIASHDPFVDYEIARDTGKPHVHLEMDGYVVCKWHIPDPEDDEVEDLIDLDSDDTTSKTPLPANAVAVVPRPWFPPVMYLDRPGIFRYVCYYRGIVTDGAGSLPASPICHTHAPQLHVSLNTGSDSLQRSYLRIPLVPVLPAH